MDKKEQTEKTIEQAENQAAPAGEVPEQVRDPLAELLSQAQNAYTAYIQAQKEVAKGYKQREEQMEKPIKKLNRKRIMLVTRL